MGTPDDTAPQNLVLQDPARQAQLRPGPAERLEALRLAVRDWAPTIAVSLPLPAKGQPLLLVLFDRNSSGAIWWDEQAGRYRWASGPQPRPEAGHPDRLGQAARDAAKKLNAPVRTT
jgi:hypothetical protein